MAQSIGEMNSRGVVQIVTTALSLLIVGTAFAALVTVLARAVFH